RAADLVAQLLEPPVIESAGAPETATDARPTPAPAAPTAATVVPTDAAAPTDAAPADQADPSDPVAPMPLLAPPSPAGRDERTAGTTVASDGNDPAPTRIPVLDLDRLRSWLTLGDVNLGRLAIVSVELDNLGFVEERLGYAAGGHLIEAITQ